MFYLYQVGLDNVRDLIPGKGKRLFYLILAPWLFLVIGGLLGARTRLEHLSLLVLLIFLSAKETRMRVFWSLLFAALTFILQYLLIFRLSK